MGNFHPIFSFWPLTRVKLGGNFFKLINYDSTRQYESNDTSHVKNGSSVQKLWPFEIFFWRLHLQIENYGLVCMYVCMYVCPYHQPILFKISGFVVLKKLSIFCSGSFRFGRHLGRGRPPKVEKWPLWPRHLPSNYETLCRHMGIIGKVLRPAIKIYP